MARHGFIAMALTAALVPATGHAQEARGIDAPAPTPVSVLPAELVMAAHSAARSDARAYRAMERQASPRENPIQIAMVDTRTPFSGR